MQTSAAGPAPRRTVPALVRALVPVLWSVLLALLLLGSALAPGYVLGYDMVWVPDLSLGRDALGLGSGLPRAVPSDAVVAVLDEVVPGMLLQKLVLLGSLVGAGTGLLRLVPDLPLVARLAAVTVVQWNPFVAERLAMGHWPVLVTYAVLPWVVVVATRRPRPGVPAALWWLVPLASLSASGGLAAAVTVLACLRPGPGAGPWRGRTAVAALLLAANAPWLVSGLLHAGSATTDAAGGAAFALEGEGSLPGPLAALALGGIWNGEVVPSSVAGAGGWLLVALVVVLAALGARSWWAGTPRRTGVGLVVTWSVGWALAVLSWAAPGALAWLGAHVPGAGLLRDGSRLLVLCAPLLAVLAAHGAARVGRLLACTGPLRPTVAVVLVVLPVTLLPDLALGLSGRLRPTDYPAEVGAVRVLVASGRAGSGDVLLLPFSSYRRPAWNHDRKVLDPLGRYLGRDYVASDDLYVSGRLVAGEDPRAARVGAVLRSGDPAARARRLGALGIGAVVVDRSAPTGGSARAPEVAGRTVHAGPLLRVVRLSGATAPHVPAGWWPAMALAWTAYVAAAVAGATAIALSGRRRRGSSTR